MGQPCRSWDSGKGKMVNTREWPAASHLCVRSEAYLLDRGVPQCPRAVPGARPSVSSHVVVWHSLSHGGHMQETSYPSFVKDSKVSQLCTQCSKACPQGLVLNWWPPVLENAFNPDPTHSRIYIWFPLLTANIHIKSKPSGRDPENLVTCCYCISLNHTQSTHSWAILFGGVSSNPCVTPS